MPPQRRNSRNNFNSRNSRNSRNTFSSPSAPAPRAASSPCSRDVTSLSPSAASLSPLSAWAPAPPSCGGAGRGSPPSQPPTQTASISIASRVSPTRHAALRPRSRSSHSLSRLARGQRLSAPSLSLSPPPRCPPAPPRPSTHRQAAARRHPRRRRRPASRPLSPRPARRRPRAAHEANSAGRAVHTGGPRGWAAADLRRVDCQRTPAGAGPYTSSRRRPRRRRDGCALPSLAPAPRHWRRGIRWPGYRIRRRRIRSRLPVTVGYRYRIRWPDCRILRRRGCPGATPEASPRRITLQRAFANGQACAHGQGCGQGPVTTG